MAEEKSTEAKTKIDAEKSAPKATALQNPTNRGTQQKTKEAPKKSNVLKWILIGCSSCLVLFILFFVLVYMGASRLTAPAASKAQEFINELKNNDYDKAYVLLSDNFKAIVVSKSDFKDLLDSDDLEPLKKIKKVAFSCKVMENDTAWVSGKLTLKDDSTKPITLQLVKDGDEWKVDVFSTIEEDTKQCTDKQ